MRRAALLTLVFLLTAAAPAAASGDADFDGVPDGSDNCPAVYNPAQTDSDLDLVGDACDNDIDGDGYTNSADAFPSDPSEHLDTDGDGVGDNADTDDDGDGRGDGTDNCPLVSNAGWADEDSDGIGDACDGDRDGDTYDNGVDAFPDDPTRHADTDGDGVADPQDNCPTVANTLQTDIENVTGGSG